MGDGEVEGEVAVFSAKHLDRRNRAELIDSAIPCHDAMMVRPYRVSNPFRLTILTSKSEDETTAPLYLLGLLSGFAFTRQCCYKNFST